MSEPIRSRDLAGRALDLAVARAEGLVYTDGWLVRPSRRANGRWKGEHTMPLADYRPSQDWEVADHRTRADSRVLQLARLASAQRARPSAVLRSYGG